MNTLFGNKIASKALTRATLLGLVGALLTTGFVVVYANISATDLGAGDEEISLSVNTFVDDTEVTVDNSAIGIVSATAGALGDTTGTAVETVIAAYAPVNNALTADRYSYAFDMHETAVADWLAGEQFRIRVYGYDSAGPTSTLLATLYTKQVTAVGATIEGVRVTVDLGSTSAVKDNFDIIIDRY